MFYVGSCGCFPPHCFDDVFGRSNKCGDIIAYESVTPDRTFLIDISREGKNFPIVVAGEMSSDKCSAFFGRFDDEGCFGHSRYDAVAGHEIDFQDRLLGGIFGEKSTILFGFSGRNAVYRRIKSVQAVGKDTDGR